MHRTHVVLQASSQNIDKNVGPVFWHYHSRHVFLQCPQQAPKSQHSQGYTTQISYAFIPCAPGKAPEFG